MACLKKGSVNWLHQRFTALVILLSLLILSILFVCFDGYSSIAFTPGGFVIEPMSLTEKIRYGLKHPIIASIVIVTFLCAFYHSFLGIRMILEDYIHHTLLQHMLIGLAFILHFFFAVLSVVLILF